MDLRWLQDFLTLAECGRFSTAAELRNLSQSAFSRRIQSLETWAGTPLIDRSCFPMRLTTAGEQLRSNAAEIVRKVVDARGEAAATGHDLSSLRVAMPQCLATSQFPQWFGRWKACSGADSIRLHVGNVLDSVGWLDAGVVDLLVCFRHAGVDIQLDPHAYMRIAIGAECLRLYRPAAMEVDEEQLHAEVPSARYPYIAYSHGVYLQRLIELNCEDMLRNNALQRVCETDFVDGARDLVCAGVGLAWLPESSASNAVASAKIEALSGWQCQIPMEICMYGKRAGPAQEMVGRVFDQYR